MFLPLLDATICILLPLGLDWIETKRNISNQCISLQTELYTKGLIGLKTLIARKVKFIGISGNNLLISLADMQNYTVPYSVHDASLAKNLATGSSSLS